MSCFSSGLGACLVSFRTRFVTLPPSSDNPQAGPHSKEQRSPGIRSLLTENRDPELARLRESSPSPASSGGLADARANNHHCHRHSRLCRCAVVERCCGSSLAHARQSRETATTAGTTVGNRRKGPPRAGSHCRLAIGCRNCRSFLRYRIGIRSTTKST